MSNLKDTQPNYFSTYFIDRVSDKRPDSLGLSVAGRST